MKDTDARRGRTQQEGTMSTPMIIPVIATQGSPSTCASCGKIEKTKTVCAYCGQEYLDVDGGVLIPVFILSVIIILIYLTVTVVWWLVDGVPLFQVFHDQWEWVKSVRIK